MVQSAEVTTEMEKSGMPATRLLCKEPLMFFIQKREFSRCVLGTALFEKQKYLLLPSLDFMHSPRNKRETQ